MKTVASLILAAAVQLFAQTRNWQDAKVIDIPETVVAVAAWGDTNIRHYKIETEDTVYVLNYVFNAAVKAPWPKTAQSKSRTRHNSEFRHENSRRWA